MFYNKKCRRIRCLDQAAGLVRRLVPAGNGWRRREQETWQAQNAPGPLWNGGFLQTTHRRLITELTPNTQTSH